MLRHKIRQALVSVVRRLPLGLGHWLTRGRRGATLAQVLAEFAGPSEAHRRASNEMLLGPVCPVRRLYTDLLIRSLSNMIYGDPPLPPLTAGREQAYSPKVRKIGRDWPSIAHTMVGLARLENLRDLAQAAIDKNIPGDFIETGVWRGGCCILMRGVLAANLITDRKVYVADSFAGLPRPNPAKYPEDEEDKLYTYKELAVSVEQVKANFAAYGLLDDKVVFVQGFFQDTLPKLDAGPLALIRLDGDMYESTIVALDALYPRLSPGGFIIVDDYGNIKACRQAVTDYRNCNMIDTPIQGIDWSGIWWQKPKA